MGIEMEEDEGGQGFAANVRWGCIVFFGVLVLITLGRLVMDGRREHHQEMAKPKSGELIDAEYCRAERSRSDNDAIAECENAARLFGQDISDNPKRLSACLENHQDRLKTCAEKGL
jgi:hypothetical protein